MSVDRIRELLALMDENDLAELELKEGEFEVRLRKRGAEMHAVPAPLAVPAPAAHPTLAATGRPGAADENDPGLTPITSPIVGTFYRSPSPDADPFVAEGAEVDTGTVVCIVEAMKIMNEVKAGIRGTVEKVLIENGEPVEYGQPLFLVRV